MIIVNFLFSIRTGSLKTINDLKYIYKMLGGIILCENK